MDSSTLARLLRYMLKRIPHAQIIPLMMESGFFVYSQRMNEAIKVAANKNHKMHITKLPMIVFRDFFLGVIFTHPFL